MIVDILLFYLSYGTLVGIIYWLTEPKYIHWYEFLLMVLVFPYYLYRLILEK